MKREMGTFVAAVVAAIGISAGVNQAHAQTMLDSYTLNFDLAAAADEASPHPTIVAVSGIDDWGLINARSVVVFNDTNGDGLPSEDETFTDYILVRVNNFGNVNGDPVVIPGYGNVHELTMKIVLTGTQTDSIELGSLGGAFDFDSIVQWDMIYDAADDAGGNFTLSTFTNLSTFSDGTVVESLADLVFGDGSSNPVEFTEIDGRTDFAGRITDLLDDGDFQSDYVDPLNNNTPIDTSLLSIIGVIDANFARFQPPASEAAIIAAFAAEFGFSVEDGQFALAFESDGTFNKVGESDVIPEPASLALLGLGGITLLGRRRRQA